MHLATSSNSGMASGLGLTALKSKHQAFQAHSSVFWGSLALVILLCTSTPPVLCSIAQMQSVSKGDGTGSTVIMEMLVSLPSSIMVVMFSVRYQNQVGFKEQLVRKPM